MSNRIPNIFNCSSLFSIFISLINLSVLLVITWACYHGFELSDESFYFLGYLYSDNNPGLSALSFHLVYSRFFSFFEFSLPGVRLLRLFLTILASLVLYFGVRKVSPPTSTSERVVLFNIVLSGMLLSYTWAPLALSYNSMSSIFIGLVIGFWLISLGSTLRTIVICWAALGALFVLLFFVKITNIILLPLLLIATLYWYQKKEKKKELNLIFKCSLAFCIGVIVALAIISHGLLSIPQTIENHLQELFGMANTDSSHSLSALWEKYYKNARMVVQRLKYPMLLLVALFVLFKTYLFVRKPKTKLWPLIIFKIAGISILLALIYQNQYWQGGGTRYVYLILIPYIFISAFVLFNRFNLDSKIDFILFGGLLSVPIAGAIGTNNGLSAQVLFYGVFIFLIIYYLVYTSKYNWFKYSVLGITMLLSTSQIISATVFNPYRQSELIAANQELEEIPNLKNLMVSPSVFKLNKDLHSIKNLDAKYAFTYSGIRGITLLLNKKPYSLEWFNEDGVQKICSIIKKSKIAPEDILFLIPEELPLAEEVISCLENKGINFKTEYSKIKTLEFYHMGHKKTMTLNVYHYTPKID